MSLLASKENNTTVEKVISCKDLAVLEDADVLQQLTTYINQLILTSFESLVQLLYRIDVSEMKIKALLKENPQEDAGFLIAQLIIARQIQKLKTIKEMFDTTAPDDGEERW